MVQYKLPKRVLHGEDQIVTRAWPPRTTGPGGREFLLAKRHVALMLLASGIALSGFARGDDITGVLKLLEGKDVFEEQLGDKTAAVLRTTRVKLRVVGHRIPSQGVTLNFAKRLDGKNEYFFMRVIENTLERRIYRTDAQLRLISAGLWDNSGGREISRPEAERELRREVALWADIVRYIPGKATR